MIGPRADRPDHDRCQSDFLGAWQSGLHLRRAFYGGPSPIQHDDWNPIGQHRWGCSGGIRDSAGRRPGARRRGSWQRHPPVRLATSRRASPSGAPFVGRDAETQIVNGSSCTRRSTPIDAPVSLFASSPAIPLRYSTLAPKRRSTPLCDLALDVLPGDEPGGPEADRRATRPTG